MVKKSIATALLVVMVAWAEMALAPTLAMHLWQVYPAHEMAANMAAHRHVMPAGHPCCPKIGKNGNANLIEFAASSLPCQDEHRCCFLQAPQNLPVPVKAGRKLSQEIALAEIGELRSAVAESHSFTAKTVVPGSPPGLFGMILRV